MKYKRATYGETKAGDLVELAAASPSLTGEVEVEPGVLLANGAAVSRSRFSKLFERIGTGYGAGDGSTTFNLPNAQGRMLVGRDATQTEFDVLAETGGTETHTLTSGEMPAHTHTLTINAWNVSGWDRDFVTETVDAGANTGVTTSQGGGGAHENRAPYQVVNYGVVYL
jgi:microcystin-dependent protein